MKKYKIVVLSNLDSSTQNILKSAVSLAKMINGEIELFSVTKPTEIISRESQLSAMRTINNTHNATSKKINNLIKPLIKDYGIAIKHSFVFGNIKNEIKNFIEERQPDIIVLGKKKHVPFKLIGDSVTQHIFKIFRGTVMIAADKNTLEPNKEISLGILNNSNPLDSLEFADDLIANTKSSLKSFKMVKKLGSYEKIAKPASEKKVEYVFEHNDSSIKKLSNYVSKSNINLLYLNRVKKQADNLITPNMKSFTTNLDVTLLVSTE